MPIDLRDPTSIPPHLISALKPFVVRLANEEFLETLFEDPRFLAIASELDHFCECEGVVGFHYTRSFPEKIMSEGLLSSTGAQRREAFLRQHGGLFTAEQVAKIQKIWAEYFDPQQDRARDHKVWFDLTMDALSSGGADRLLANFGGEVVYMPLCSDGEIAPILRQIGRPLVVECELDAAKVSASAEYPWGKVLLSSYHRTINHEAHTLDYSCRMRESLPADRVVRIHDASDLGWVESTRY